MKWVAWLAEILAEARRVLVPGAYAFIWALPKRSHWTATAIEDAGFEIRDVVTHLFGQGFPKSKASLKPGSEHWILARAPGPRRDLAIDACRIGTGGGTKGSDYDRSTLTRTWKDCGTVGGNGKIEQLDAGRWPAHVAFTHSEGCELVGSKKVRSAAQTAPVLPKNRGGFNGPMPEISGVVRHGNADADGLETVDAWRCAPGCPVAELDAQSGDLHGAGYASDGKHCPSGDTAGYSGGWAAGHPSFRFGDTGGASRFFYCGKASSSERDEHIGGDGNQHPTVKPIALMRWLTRLILPPGGLVLDPFTGSGTTGIAALLEGGRFLGIEKDPKFAALARTRIANAMGPLFAGVL